jgi:hypothetical protein
MCVSSQSNTVVCSIVRIVSSFASIGNSPQSATNGISTTAQPALQLAGAPLLQSSDGSSQHSAVTAAERAEKSDIVHEPPVP